MGVLKGKVMFSFPETKISLIVDPCRGTSLIRNNPLLGHYSRTIHRVLWWCQEGGLFFMSEVPLCRRCPPESFLLLVLFLLSSIELSDTAVFEP